MTSSGEQRLRVAIFGESYLPYLSGVTVSTETLSRGLGAAGHDVLLVAPRPRDGASPGSAGARGPEPTYAWLPSYQGPPPAPPGYRMPLPLPSDALRAARDFAPDVVHAQSPFVSGLMARRLAQHRRAPLVFTHHTRFGDYRHYLGPLAIPGAAVAAAYLRDFWRGCAGIVAPGEDLATEIRAELAGRGRPLVRAIPTGIDVAWVAGLDPVDPRQAQGWPSDSVVLVALGRLAVEKSVEELVEAFGVAADRDSRLRLLLLGGGPAEAALRERIARPDIAGRAAATGSLARRDALALLRGSDVFACASRTETQGLVVAEALACGLPVVAIDAPGVRDAVRNGEDGILVADNGAAGRVSGLADAMGVLADAGRRSAMARPARDGAGRFDVAARIDEVVALYRELRG